MLHNLVNEVKMELQPLDLLVRSISEFADTGSAAELGFRKSGAELKSFCESARTVCAAVLQKHTDTLAKDFNRDETLSRLVMEGVEMKVKALQSETFRSELLAEWFSKAAHVSESGLGKCVGVVGAHLFSGASLVDRQGTTPLLVACERGNLAIVKVLIDANASINIKDTQGKTALLKACESPNFAIFEELIKAGADIEVFRHDNATALALCVLSSDWKCVELCLRRRLKTLGSIQPLLFLNTLDLRQLASLYLYLFTIGTQLQEGMSPRALIGEMGAVLAALEANTHHITGTEFVATLVVQLGRVRAFTNYHCDILQDPPVSLMHTVMQLAAQESDNVFGGDYAKIPAAEGGAYEPAIIEWLHKPQTSRMCQLTLQSCDKVRGVAYSLKGCKVARAIMKMVVVCDAVTGFEFCRLMGHSKDNPKCLCKHTAGPRQTTYESNPNCLVNGHSDW